MSYINVRVYVYSPEIDGWRVLRIYIRQIREKMVLRPLAKDVRHTGPGRPGVTAANKLVFD